MSPPYGTVWIKPAGYLPVVSLALGVIAFGAGAWLLVESVEGLVTAIRGWALAGGLSGTALAALVLGFDLEATAAGVAATLDDLPGTALGTSLGAAIFLLTAGLGIAGLVAPFRVRPPGALVVATALASILPTPLLLDGELSRLDGALLVAMFVPLFALVFRVRRSGVAPPDDPDRPGRPLLRVLAGIAGLVVGAELLVFGTGRVVDEAGVSETVFGLLVVAAAVSFEEVVLEALPAYRGFPELSVGNALGTVVFLMTASLGVIALVRPLEIPDAVRELHAPALAAAAALALALLWRGRLGRPEGLLLVAAYGAYAGLAVAVGG